MKFTSWLAAWHTPRGGRSPQPVNKVPFKAILPMKLKDRLSGKYDVGREGNCLYEMSLVLACLAENEYENKYCKKQVDSFNTCYETYLKNTWHAKRAQERGVLVPGEKNFTNKQLRTLFKMYPNV